MIRDWNWNALIRQALEGPEGEPFLRLLKERLRSGSQVVSVRLDKSGGAPEYVIILSLLKQLSEMRVPHSDAFTSWSFDTGTRMADEEQEQARFTLLVRERIAEFTREVGSDRVMSALANRLQELGPPRTLKEVQMLQPLFRAGAGHAAQRMVEKVDAVLLDLARALGRSLKYDEATTSRILDGALAQWLSRRQGPSMHPILPAQPL